MKLPTLIKTDHPIPWCCSRLLRRPTLCGLCFSLNKWTSYLSLCLSLNSFCNEKSRTWASLSPEARCVISAKRLGSSPSLGFGWVQALAHGFKSQSELHSFTKSKIIKIIIHHSEFFPYALEPPWIVLHILIYKKSWSLIWNTEH